MSSYNPRKAPNVSAYLQNLNTIPSPHDQQHAAQGEFDFNDGNLDLFASTDFFDFDGSFANPAPELDLNQHAPQPAQQQQSQNNVAMTGPGFQFSEFQTFPHLAESPASLAPSPTNGLQGPYPAQQGAHFQPGDKRKASAANIAPVADLEEQSRFAAEEDKRRRNTAASARFRVKKKQREAELEKKSKEMTDKLTSLENKVHQLEMENKWLKGLITEKSDAKGMEEQFKKFSAESQAKAVSSSLELRTDGVGTEEAGKEVTAA
ncbi:hypothetical protein Q7P37_008814 [Cladosporium fusiforme]